MTAKGIRLKGVQRNESELLVDVCSASRPRAAAGALDPETGLEATGGTELIKAGMPCWVKIGSQPTTVAAPGETVLVQYPMLAVSLAEPSLREGDIVTITDAAELSNVGMRLRVRTRQRGSFITLARYQVEVVA